MLILRFTEAADWPASAATGGRRDALVLRSQLKQNFTKRLGEAMRNQSAVRGDSEQPLSEDVSKMSDGAGKRPENRKRIPNRIRRAASKEAVLKSARRLFVTRGYLASSVDDIARCATLSKGGIYFHFTDKSQILRELLLESSALYAGIVETLNDATIHPRDRIASWVNEVSRLGAQEPELILLPILISLEFLGKEDEIERLVKMHYEAIHSGLMKALTQGRRAGVFHCRLPLREEAASLAALADGALLEWLRRKRRLNGKAFVRALRYLVLTGICQSPDGK